MNRGDHHLDMDGFAICGHGLALQKDRFSLVANLLQGCGQAQTVACAPKVGEARALQFFAMQVGQQRARYAEGFGPGRLTAQKEELRQAGAERQGRKAAALRSRRTVPLVTPNFDHSRDIGMHGDVLRPVLTHHLRPASRLAKSAPPGRRRSPISSLRAGSPESRPWIRPDKPWPPPERDPGSLRHSR